MSAEQKNTALVVGGSGDIGQAVAGKLLDMGYAVALAARGEERLKATRLRLAKNGADVECFPCDLTREAEIEALVASVMARWGRLDLLVNASGIAKGDFVMRARADIWEELFRTNALGAALLCKAAYSAMKRQGSGHIISIGSAAGRKGQLGLAAYGASKAAMMAMTDSLREEARRHGIKVSTVAPERVATRMQGAAPDAHSLIVPGDIAEAVAFLLRLSPAASVPELPIQAATENAKG